MSDYRPGSCNINQKESKKRYLTGAIFLSIAIIFSFGYFILDLPIYMMGFSFVAFTSGFMGVLQGRENFCVKHAKKRTEKTTEKAEEVEDKEKVEEDNSKANKILIQSVLLGAMITSILILVSINLI